MQAQLVVQFSSTPTYDTLFHVSFPKSSQNLIDILAPEIIVSA